MQSVFSIILVSSNIILYHAITIYHNTIHSKKCLLRIERCWSPNSSRKLCQVKWEFGEVKRTDTKDHSYLARAPRNAVRRVRLFATSKSHQNAFSWHVRFVFQIFHKSFHFFKPSTKPFMNSKYNNDSWYSITHYINYHKLMYIYILYVYTFINHWFQNL